jgi:hypothetical protein
MSFLPENIVIGEDPLYIMNRLQSPGIPMLGFFIVFALA